MYSWRIGGLMYSWSSVSPCVDAATSCKSQINRIYAKLPEGRHLHRIYRPNSFQCSAVFSDPKTFAQMKQRGNVCVYSWKYFATFPFQVFAGRYF